MDNILARMWIWVLDDTGLYAASILPGEDLLAHIPAREEGVFGIAPADFTVWERQARKLSGHRVLLPDDYMDVASSWLCSSMNKGVRPVMLYLRKRMDLAQIQCLVVTSCADFVFLMQTEQEKSVIYRNSEQMIMVVQVPDMPQLPVLRKSWQSWTQKKVVVASSIRYFVERDEDESLLVHSMGINSQSMRILQNANFEWDRQRQIWVGHKRKARAEDLFRIVAEDASYGPERLGFVPEWYAARQLYKYRPAVRYTMDVSLWNTLFGYR
jgi:hypothetical protein